jgi:hypothetical protein
MKRKMYSTGNLILMGIYGLSLIGAIALAVVTEGSERHQNINLAVWITSTAMWYHLFKVTKHKRDQLVDAADIPASTVGQKALTSAPSNLTTYEKGVYEEGFKDGVNYIKNQLNSSL